MAAEAMARLVWDAVEGAEEPGQVPRRMCTAVREGLGAHAVTIALLTHLPERQLLCASGDVGVELEELQFATGEGPCITAAAASVAVLWNDVRRPQAMWPVFGPLLDERLPSVRAVQAYPLLADGACVGSMDVVYQRPQTMDRGPLERAEAAAGAVADVLLDRGRALLGGPAPGEWEPTEVIDAHWGSTRRASGLLAARHHLTVDQALSVLRARAMASGQPLPQLSAAVLAGADPLSDGDPPGP
ncbi:ANTAR domain-containing protein [Streptomyces sp. NPDC049813]|uniref:ANTAR domain-containing protein n=1 Tax=Streptomyces sp. NPDC049813 TaxID=3365597 RepID=UPI0037BC0440